jgi:uroporphyrinogen decarboxylase
MKPRERFVTALRCGLPDRVPVYDFVGGRGLQKQLLGYTTDLYEPETQAKLAEALGFDGFLVFVDGFCGIEDVAHPEGAQYRDNWGVTYVKHGWPIMPHTATPIKCRADWSNYTMPDFRGAGRGGMIRRAVEANPAELAVLAAMLGPLTMMFWYLMDASTLSTMLFEDPDLIHEMCSAYVAWATRAAEFAVRSGPIDAFYLADDWGSSTGLLMSPRHLREFFLEPYRQIVAAMKRLGVPVIMHNDGKIWDMLDDLVATGVNAYHPVERAAGMDLARVKRLYGTGEDGSAALCRNAPSGASPKRSRDGRLCLIGNINNKTTMVSGTPQDVRREALACLRIGAPGGGYVLATDHSLHDDIPLENVRAYVEVAHRYGVYPLELPSVEEDGIGLTPDERT